MYVYLNSTSMELNITEIEPDLIEYLQDEEKVSLLEKKINCVLFSVYVKAFSFIVASVNGFF